MNYSQQRLILLYKRAPGSMFNGLKRIFKNPRRKLLIHYLGFPEGRLYNYCDVLREIAVKIPGDETHLAVSVYKCGVFEDALHSLLDLIELWWRKLRHLLWLYGLWRLREFGRWRLLVNGLFRFGASRQKAACDNQYNQSGFH